jgi:hypothetical protein
LKPLIIALALRHPSIKQDYNIVDAIFLDYVKINVFDELAQMDIMSKKVEFVTAMSDSLKYTDESGNDRYFFSREWLVKEYLGLTDDQMRANKKYLKQERDESLRLASQAEKLYDENDTGDSNSFGSDTTPHKSNADTHKHTEFKNESRYQRRIALLNKKSKPLTEFLHTELPERPKFVYDKSQNA